MAPTTKPRAKRFADFDEKAVKGMIIPRRSLSSEGWK